MRRVTEQLWPGGASKLVRQLGTIDKRGEFVNRPRLPVRREIKRVDFVLGGTLHRVALLSCSKNELWTLDSNSLITACIKMTTVLQQEIFCDMCAGEQHRPGNGLCSASLGAGRSPLNQGVAYCALTKEPKLYLSISDCTVVEQQGPVLICQFRPRFAP